MLDDYTEIVKKIFAPIICQYDLKFAQIDGDEMFLIGKGFALNVFIDRRDRRGDVWYVSIDSDGAIRLHTLMYIYVARFTCDDRKAVGASLPQEGTDEYIAATFRVANQGFLNHCQDILSGDKAWLKNYQDEEGVYSRHIARFLKPIFESQGYHVAPVPDSYNS